MTRRLKRAVMLVASASLAAGLAACGEAAQTGHNAHGGGTPGASAKIGLLLPDVQTARYEALDRPLIEKKVHELCGHCSVAYANAQQDVAAQHRQVDSLIANGADALVLDAVDPTSMRSSVQQAHDAHIPVVAYDRLTQGPVSAYVSFDGEQVGRLQGTALLKAMGRKSGGDQIVMMNGSPTDANAARFKAGAMSVLKHKVRIGKAYDTADWRPENANTNMSGAIAALGADSINGVYSANDALASGVISALKAANIKPLPPVTGQDAELAAIQRIVEGEQYMTVYKPIRAEADAAARMAVALVHGQKLDGMAPSRVDSPTTKGVPAVLLRPVAVTAANIKDTVVKDGTYTISQICSPKFRAACDKAGLT